MICRIALDAMGGDRGLPVNIEGALMARKEMDHEIILVGDENLIRQELVHHRAQDAFLIRHAPTVIGMHEKPAEACRAKKDSSIMVCAEMVAEGQADTLISAGHSGAAMAASLWHMKRLPGVSRPAIAVTFPTVRGFSVLLDMGANVDCKPKHLFQFAVMGSIYARALLGIENPKVGLMTIGEEEGKGNEVVNETHPLLKDSHLNYIGHVEGRDIPKGVADVFVCDGFVGNIILKFGEGLAEVILGSIKSEIKKHPLSSLAAKFLLQGPFQAIKKKMDPSEFGGAPLLGVGGASFICHGGAEPVAIKNAIRNAAILVEKEINRQISEELHESANILSFLKASA